MLEWTINSNSELSGGRLTRSVFVRMWLLVMGRPASLRRARTVVLSLAPEPQCALSAVCLLHGMVQKLLQQKLVFLVPRLAQ